jgi:hypothetical protein
VIVLFSDAVFQVDGSEVDTLVTLISHFSISREKLKKVIRLYVDLRLLCICPLEVFTLRRIIWAASFQKLFLRPFLPEPAPRSPTCLVNRARVECGLPRISQSAVLSPPLLKRLIAHGKIISPSKSSGLTTLGVDDLSRRLFLSLCALYEALLDTLSRALTCDSHQSALLLHERLTSLTHRVAFSINVTGEYAYARLLSIVTRKPRSVAGDTSADERNPLQVQESPAVVTAEDTADSVPGSLAPFAQIGASLFSHATQFAECLLPSSLAPSHSSETDDEASVVGDASLTAMMSSSATALRGQSSSPPPPPVSAAAAASTEAETFCWCKGPEGGPMICCESCDVWFHCSCVGLFSKKTIKALTTESYFCISCTEIGQAKKYEYAWPSKLALASCSDNKDVKVNIIC